MRVALISDTHIPSRATAIPPWVRERVGDADHTIHAGDFETRAAYETVADLAGGDLTAVRGNMDDLDLPTTATVRLGGVEFVVTHGTGDLDGYRDRVARTVREHATEPPVVGVSGHSHEPMDEDVGGTRLLNPGSATAAVPAVEATMMTAEVDDGDLDIRLLRE